MFTTIELFAGAGGLALGLEKAGFHPLGLIEINKDACDTLRKESIVLKPVCSQLGKPCLEWGDSHHATSKHDPVKSSQNFFPAGNL